MPQKLPTFESQGDVASGWSSGCGSGDCGTADGASKCSGCGDGVEEDCGDDGKDNDAGGAIADYIAGMTDRYALDVHGGIFPEDGETP